MPTPAPCFTSSFFRAGLAAGLLAGLASVASAQTTNLLNETFDTGVAMSGWYWTGGSFQDPPTFGQAFNQVSASYQIFTKSFASTNLETGDKLQVTFHYHANSTNITRVWASLFGGNAASANGWNQYSASNGVSSTWAGYSGGIATSANPHQFLRAQGGAGGDWHPYATWDAAASFASVNGSNSALGTGSVRAARLIVENTGTSVSLTMLEGADLGSLSVAYTAIDSSAERKTTGYNIVAFEFDTSTGNGDMRYDNVLVQHIAAIPEPSAFAALAGVAGLGLAGLRRRRV